MRRPTLQSIRTATAVTLTALATGFTSPDLSAAITWADYLKASVPEESGRFGHSLALSGNTVAIGAPGESNENGTSGAVYVFVRDGDGFWNLQTRLSTPDGFFVEGFGHAVALDGDTLAIGTFIGETAFVFSRIGSAWSLGQEVLGDNTEIGDFYGQTVSLSGDTLVVGARLEYSSSTGVNGVQDNLRPNSGAAYVFVRDQIGQWTQQAFLKASNPAETDEFGGSVAIDGDTIVVTAQWEDSASSDDPSDDSVADSGAAYVFVRDAFGTWSQQAFLKASNANAGDQLSRAALSGDRLVLSAIFEDGNFGDPDSDAMVSSGAAYLFERDGSGAWSQQAYVKPTLVQHSMSFGTDVALQGDRLLVGTIGNVSAGAAGEAYVFEHDSATDTWVQVDILVAFNADPVDEFGVSVALSESHLAIGASSEDGDGDDPDNNDVFFSGAAYLYDISSSGGDTEPPVVTPPADIIGFEATGPATAVVLGNASVTDNSGESLTANPDNRGPFPLGDTTVTWSATDGAGNTGSATQLVNVVDTTAPVVTAPADVQEYLGNPVTLGTPIVVEAVGIAAQFNDWPGGDFPLGETTVTWTATDTSGNSGTDTQLVTILEPLDLDIAGFRATGRAKLSRDPVVDFVVKVKNQGNNSIDTAAATLVGTLNGIELYNETLAGISDAPGGPGMSLTFPSYVPPSHLPTETIQWLLTVVDQDPDVDEATDTTKLVP